MEPYLSHDHNELSALDLAQDSLFIRWVRGEDAEAEVFWTTWLMKHPEMEEKIEAARVMVLALQFEGESLAAHEIQHEWDKLQVQIGKPQRWFENKRTLSIAAVLLFIITPFIYLFINQYSSTQEIQLVSRSTAPGQKLFITLPDGTKIKLNADSEIQYPARFTGESRDVILKGEAFFDVVHNGRVPFKVHSEGVTVVVTGTSFNVNAYPENSDVKVALEKGEVKVKINGAHTGKEGILLKPSEMIEINKSSYNHELQKFDPLEISSWKDGVLYLGRSDFNETALKLERWFGVKFEIAQRFKSKSEWKFIGKFKNKSLQQILETLRYPDLFDYKIEGQKVFIY